MGWTAGEADGRGDWGVFPPRKSGDVVDAPVFHPGIQPFRNKKLGGVGEFFDDLGIEVVVVVVSDENDINRGQVFPWNARWLESPKAGHGKGRAKLGINGVDEEVDPLGLNEKGGMADPGEVDGIGGRGVNGCEVWLNGLGVGGGRVRG